METTAKGNPPDYSTFGSLLSFLAKRCVPLARAWVRYAPLSFAKTTLWGWFGRRAHSFEVRVRAGFRDSGSTLDTLQNRLYWFGVWEPSISEWVSRYLRPGDVVVDAGANIGYYTLLASGLVGEDGHVVAIEPATDAYRMLARSLNSNRVRNVTLIRAAIGRDRHRAVLYHGPSTNLGGSSLWMTGASDVAREEVEVVPLAELLPAALLPRISLIKIDVEGAEADALCGLEPILEFLPSHVAIVCELSPKHIAARGSTVAELLERMRALGFRVYRIVNVYGASAYLTRAVSPPCPLTGEVENLVDVVFLRSSDPER